MWPFTWRDSLDRVIQDVERTVNPKTHSWLVRSMSDGNYFANIFEIEGTKTNPAVRPTAAGALRRALRLYVMFG